MAHWIDNADSYICSACGYECNNPNKEIYGAGVCPQCWTKMDGEELTMREILFRGKRLDNGEWLYGAVANFRSIANEIYTAIIPKVDGENSMMELKSVNPSTVGQYTGLKDKNGKRIFEGDICRNTRTGEIVSVKWHGTMAGYVWNKRRADCFLFDFGELFRACDKYEVIGNIHDNQELLEADNE